jgi:hypothetical protein
MSLRTIHGDLVEPKPALSVDRILAGEVLPAANSGVDEARLDLERAGMASHPSLVLYAEGRWRFKAFPALAHDPASDRTSGHRSPSVTFAGTTAKAAR